MANKKQNLENGNNFEALNRALLDVDDIMGRALCPYLVLNETADGVLKEHLYGNEINIGVEKRYVTKEVRSVFKTYAKTEIGDHGFQYEFGGIPINVKFIKRKYNFFERPDTKFYLASEYRLPNPFDKYWKARHIVQ